MQSLREFVTEGREGILTLMNSWVFALEIILPYPLMHGEMDFIRS